MMTWSCPIISAIFVRLDRWQATAQRAVPFVPPRSGRFHVERGQGEGRRSTDCQDRDHFSLQSSRDMHLARRVNEDIDLAAHAELGLVDSGLDRETGAAENQPLLVRLE